MLQYIRLIIFFAVKDGEAHYSQQNQDLDLTGSDHQFIIVEFRLKLKKVGKITRPFRYDLNQIPYDYTVEMRNRFKGLDLMRFVTLYRRQGSRPSTWKRNAKNKMAIWGGLTNSCEKKRGKKQRRKGKI